MGDSPPIACSLTPDDLAARLGQTRQLGNSLLEVATDGPRATLRFKGDVGTRAEVERFASMESSCCPFFEFDIRGDPSGTVLAIEAPEDGTPMLRGLVAGFVAAWELPA